MDKREILVSLLGEETVSKMADRAGGGLDRFGKSLDATEKDAQDLDQQIADVEGSLKQLGVAFARTSDAADRIDISRAIRKQQAELRKLTKAKDWLPDFSKFGDEAASGFGASFVARIGPILTSVPVSGPGAAVGAALVAAIGPTLAAGLAGAVVGGAAGLGIVGGVVIATRDPRVQAAGQDLGAFILGDLEKRASSFTPAVLDGIDDIRAGWVKMGPDLTRVFSSSRLVQPLVAGLVSGGQRLVGGIADAVDAADPVVASFAGLLDGVGDAAGQAFSTLADDADEGASAIDDLTTATRNFIGATAGILHGAATVKGWADQVDIAIDKGRHWTEDWMSSGGVLEGFGIQLDLTADGFRAGTAEAEAYRAATEGTATAADFATLAAAGMTNAQIAAADASGTFRAKTEEVNGALGANGESYRNTTQSIEAFNTRLAEAFELQNQGITANLSAEQANLRLEEAIDKATAAGKANNDGISVNTEKGRANREALLGIAGAAATAAEKIHATTGSTELASQATERGRAKFLEAANAMGVEKGEAERLAAQLFGIPSVNPKVKVTTTQTPIDLKTLAGRIAAIKSKKVVITVHNNIVTTRSEGRNVGIGDGVGGRASGGPVKAGTPYVVGEEGPELITPTRDGWVHDASKTKRLLGDSRSAGSPLGGGAVVHNHYNTWNIQVPAGYDAGRYVVRLIQEYERGNGKGWRS